MSRATKLAMQETGKMERLRGNIPLTRGESLVRRGGVVC